MNNNIINDLFTGKDCPNIPIWFLRQAGRHIPEYFSIRSRAKNFIDFCLDTELIVESTKLPLKYYDIDAAIVFSDILMIPWAMNRNVRFTKNIGPTMDPMIPGETKIVKNINISQILKPLENAIKTLRKDLAPSVCLIGFSGAPWTLACYMIEGQSSKDFINTRTALWNYKKWFQELIDSLIFHIAEKLEMQANAGANVLMIFDSWSHMIPNNFYKQLAIDPITDIISLLRSRNVNVPIIGFPFKSGSSLIKYSYESNVDCIALDWTVNLNWAVKNINSSIVMQGNLDPASLIPNNSEFLLKEVKSILETMKEKKFIFNVGHGLTPECKIENVKKVINIVKEFKS
ncbi:uroporphyrinogen decarboxylase [Alphaproteobacteria bacterium]|nr:uroporphyrinogen decarboxylase [Alphaproteobacteria bacterium]